MKKSKQKNRRLKRYVRKQSKKALLEEKELYFEEKLAKVLEMKGFHKTFLDQFSDNGKQKFLGNYLDMPRGREVEGHFSYHGKIPPHHHNPEQLLRIEHYHHIHGGGIKVFDKED